MFAYCNNNPIIFGDSVGFSAHLVTQVALPDYVPKIETVSISTDDDENSNKLASQYNTNKIPKADGTVYVHVETIGKHNVDPFRYIRYGIGVVDGATAYLAAIGCTIPVYISAPLVAINSYGIVKGIFGVDDFTLEYNSYLVTETWTVTKPLEGYPGIYVRTYYTMEQSFYLNDKGEFKCFDSVFDFTTETICIWES